MTEQAEVAAMPPTEMGVECPTDVVGKEPYAWSAEEDPTQYWPRRDWRRILRLIAPFAVPTLGFLIVAAFILGGHHHQDAPMPAPPPAALPSFDPAPLPAPSLDDKYLRLLTDDGFQIQNRTAAIAGAHWVCAYLSDGHTIRDIMKMWDAQGAPGQAASQLHENNQEYVHDAIQAYCPMYA